MRRDAGGPPVDEKAALRREVRARLEAVGPRHRAAQEDLVQAIVQADAAWAAARTVAVYRAVGHELSVTGCTNAAWRLGKRTVFPRVEDGHLSWRVVASWSQLRPGAFGIPEPAPEAPRVTADEIDLWLVPGVAFTAAGGRLGRGGGFYDRALAMRRPGAPAWGVCFDEQVVDALPAEAHDVPVDRVVAPTLAAQT